MEKIELINKAQLFKRFLGVEELDFYLPERQQNMKRFVVTRPEAAAIVIFNKDKKSFVLIRQFRAPVFNRGDDPNIFEIPAGVLEPDEDPKDTIIRETWEETGYKITNPEPIKTIYPSPGLLDERIYLHFVEVTNTDKDWEGGGLASEKEYLEVHEIPVDETYRMINDERLMDAKSIIALLLVKDKVIGR